MNSQIAFNLKQVCRTNAHTHIKWYEDHACYCEEEPNMGTSELVLDSTVKATRARFGH